MARGSTTSTMASESFATTRQERRTKVNGIVENVMAEGNKDTQTAQFAAANGITTSHSNLSEANGLVQNLTEQSAKKEVQARGIDFSMITFKPPRIAFKIRHPKPVVFSENTNC